MPEFAHPSWWPLWLGLLIPLIIHLWNRREGSALKVGSVKWIPEVEERKLNSWKFTDFWRYLLRSLLLTILAVLTLQLLWPSQINTEKANKWLLLDTDLPTSSALEQWMDSLQLNGYEAHWLTIAFPLVEVPQSENLSIRNTDVDIWRLLELLAAQPDRPDSLWLITSAKLQHIQGQRPALPFHLELQRLPAEQPEAYLAKAWKPNEQEAQVLIGWSNERQLKFASSPLLLQENQQILADSLPPLQVVQTGKEQWQLQMEDQKIPVEKLEPLRLAIHKLSTDDRYYLEAAVRTIRNFTNLPIEWTDTLAVADLFFEEQNLQKQHFQQQGSRVGVASPINYSSEAMLQELVSLLTASFEPKEQVIYDQRKVPIELIQPQFVAAKAKIPQQQKETRMSWTWGLWIGALILFLTDRLWPQT